MTSTPLPQPRVQRSRTLCALAFGLALGFAAPAIADNLPEVQRLIKQAQYPQALEKVDAYLGSRPKDAQGRFLKGLIFTEMNRPADAIAVFTKLTEDYPELPEPYNNLAVLYAQQKQYDKARTALEMAIRTHPSYAIAYENLGDVYAKLASQAYDKALQLDNSNAIAQNKLALIRDLITTNRGNVKPVASSPPAPAPAPVVAPSTPSKPLVAPVASPTASVLAATPGAASTTLPPKALEKMEKAENKAESKASADNRPPPAPATAFSVDDDITKALTAWAAAWSRKDMKGYFAAYASDFTPPKGMTRKAWEDEREHRIAGKGGKISVTIDTPQVAVNGNQATVKFRQHYKAPGISSSAAKTLILVRAGDKWLIKDENAR